MSSESVPAVISTLRDVQSCLRAAGLPTVSVDHWRNIRRRQPADRLVDALRRAVTDPTARHYLEQLVAPKSGAGGGGRQLQMLDLSGQEAAREVKPDPEAASSADPVAIPFNTEGEGGEDPEYLSVHVYAGKAALCFNADTTRAGVPTVAIDAAGGVNRQFDWENKVRIQLTRQELPIVAAVVLGYRSACEFKNHGADKDKGFSMERQKGGRVFVRVFARDQGVKAVPIEVADGFYVAGLFMRQLGKVMPWLDGTGILMTLRTTVRG